MGQHEKFVIFAINHFGTGQHPAASPQTLAHFQPAYVAGCIRRAIASGKISPEAVALGQAMLAELARGLR